MYNTENVQDKVILVGLSDLSELAELAHTGNCQILGEIIQTRETAHPKSYIGKGKLEELKNFLENTGANGIITDDELSSSQLNYLSTQLEVKVMDRTMLILDIFATNAKSAEAIAQVEIAQQRYSLSHLKGLGISMSRLGGGIGTRGPGEKKLETDRRAIRNRISELSKQLDSIETHRHAQRKARLKSENPVLSLVGYTNAGKSTLMNVLTNSQILAENRLFATLDTTTRKIINSSQSILLTDTVGFIQKLPHSLIKAFRSTLEELKFATILLHVVDISNENYMSQMNVVYSTLDQLECNHIPIITVFNKIDANITYSPIIDERAKKIVSISAKNGTNIDALLSDIYSTLENLEQKVTLLIPHNKGSIINSLYKDSHIIYKEYRNNGIFVIANINPKNLTNIKAYIVKE